MMANARTPPAPAPATVADVHTARQRLAGRVVATPVLESLSLNAMLGARVLVKAEPLQLTGTFKIRGAMVAQEKGRKK